MTDTQVIEGLECCAECTNDDPFARCMECPYNEIGISMQDCRAVLSRDALNRIRWIPCEERMPKNDREVITTYEIKGKRYVETASWTGESWVSVWDEYRTWKDKKQVVAWMPLPSAYGGNE